MDSATLISILGVLGLGSIIVQAMASGGQKRASRAAVLEALGSCENARWAPLEADEPTFLIAYRRLESAALLARIPREAVRLYGTLGLAASWESHEAFDQNPDPEYGGGIDTDHAAVTREAAEVVINLVWHPYRSRLRLKSRIAKVAGRAESLPKFGSAVATVRGSGVL